MLKIKLPAFNWFVHVLNKFEFPGKDIVLDHSHGTSKDKIYSINCDSENTKELIVTLAKEFELIEEENFKLREELQHFQGWRPVSEFIPDGPHSSRSSQTMLVSSPALRYIVMNGVAVGRHDGKDWSVMLKGKWVPHKITHWRPLPPPIDDGTPFEEIKAEIDELRKLSEI